MKEAALREKAWSIFAAAVKAADPRLCLRKFLQVKNGRLIAGKRSFRLKDLDRIFVVGGGKASVPMAQAAEEILNHRITEGLVISNVNSGVALKKIKGCRGGHPFPNEEGARGTRKMIEILSGTGENDLVICLLSGGGSALMVSPWQGISLEDKREMLQLLFQCGANIDEVNTIRKHLSGIKGGRLAKLAYPARVVSLILSDVIGDRLDSIASGPTAPDPTTFADCMRIIRRYKLIEKVPQSVRFFLEENIGNQENETLKPANKIFKKVHNLIIGSNHLALQQGLKEAKRLGFNTSLLSSSISGDTTLTARKHGQVARQIRLGHKKPAPPACVVSGGETTVVIKGNGLGGRNQEFVLVSALEIEGLKDVVIASLNTDGLDGPTDASGAICDGLTISRARSLGLEPEEYLKRNDSYHFFEELGDLIKTGPTNTNVMDLHLILVG